MYTACMFCHHALGANESIEHFPVGRRLAFDAAKGRLWVVCRRCERWNLTPLEARWEAVEECDRNFRATRLRVSTDNIGFARLSEGLDLVRIGAPQRPEMAAWRYGDQFGRRRNRAFLIGGGVVMASGALLAGAAAAGMAVGSTLGFWGNIPNLVNALKVVRLKTDNGRIFNIRGRALAEVQLVVRPHGLLELTVKSWGARQVFQGDEALRHARRLLPAINSSGGSRRAVQDAVGLLAEGDRSRELVATLVRSAQFGRYGKTKPVAKMSGTTRLALEMALHEETERQAIEGELETLEAAWREAEEIASIADNMFMPDGIERKLREMKAREKQDVEGN
jgi:hypothetical protein